jgi:site-specific DNA-methyltransferase (adenine-specific)
MNDIFNENVPLKTETPAFAKHVLPAVPSSEVYLEDCVTALKRYADNHFDLAIVDPPYGINFDGNTTVKGKGGKANTFSNKQHHDKKGWDTDRPTDEYFAELQRVSKNQIIWGGNYFADLLPAKKGWIFWDKKITNANNTNFSDGELAWTSFDCILRRFAYDWIGFGYLNNPQKEKKIHPTQKPIQLYSWILNTYAKPNDLILDTHLGSGSSRIAAYKGGFNFVGFEIDKEYYEKQEKRFNDFKSQLRLF